MADAIIIHDELSINDNDVPAQKRRRSRALGLAGVVLVTAGVTMAVVLTHSPSDPALTETRTGVFVATNGGVGTTPPVPDPTYTSHNFSLDPHPIVHGDVEGLRPDSTRPPSKHTDRWASQLGAGTPEPTHAGMPRSGAPCASRTTSIPQSRKPRTIYPTPAPTYPTPSPTQPTPAPTQPSVYPTQPIAYPTQPPVYTTSPPVPTSANPTVQPSMTPTSQPTSQPTTLPTSTPSPTNPPAPTSTSPPAPTSTPSPSTRPPTTRPSPQPSPQPQPSPSPSPAPQPGPSNGDLKAQIIHQTTVLRAAHGLGPVTWNDELAAKMQAWADSNPQKNGGGHGGPPGNQNLAGFVVCNNDCMHTAGPAWNWYSSEEKLWDYDSNQSKDGNWMTTGHFSNSMDPGVNQVACGYSTYYNPNIGKDDSLVWCNYLGGTNGKIPRPSVDQATLVKQILV